MNFRTFLSKRFLQFLCGSVFIFLACHLSQDVKVENTLSFTSQFDSLSKFDSVQIEVKDLSGKVLGIIYRGHVDTLSEIEKLSTPDWDGGKILITITGFNKGSSDPAFKVEKQFDGQSNTLESSIVYIHPNPGLSAGTLQIQLTEGQSFPLPSVTVTPADLVDRSLRWASSNPSVAAVQNGSLQAGTRGSASLTARLNIDSTKSLRFEIAVQADPKIPESLTLDRDTLHLAENGAPGQFGVQINPASASLDVNWRLQDSSVAGLTSTGLFQGLKKGLTKVWAASKVKPTILDSGFILVSAPILVEKVRFLKESIELFVGGASEVLAVEVLPLKANQEVEFKVTDPSKAALNGNKLVPVSEGLTTVTVQSKENPSLADTLTVKVSVPVTVGRVEVSDPVLVLYRGGPGKSVSARVYPPEAPPAVQWVSLTPGVATVSLQGEIKPISAGLAQIVAISQADSLKRDSVAVSVKVDAPQLAAGNDTTVSAGQSVSFLPTAPQEYGQIVRFKWDLDGNQQWDDSADGIQEVSFHYGTAKEYGARFFVRDTEGNEALVTRRITVVGGVTVEITSPAHNSSTNQKTIPVVWSVNKTAQSVLTSQDLVVGANTISRSAQDSAGKVFTASVTVYLDTAAPLAPKVYGTSPTNAKPAWTWSSGGGGGSGEFRYRLADDTFPANAPTTRDTAYVLVADPVSGTTYTLYVQEKDAAGNWSPSSHLSIQFDITKPIVVIASPQASGTYYTTAATVSLSGTASGPLPVTKVAYRAGTGAVLSATLSGSTWTTPALTLQEGISSPVTITATDNAGNTGEAVLSLFLDNTPPSAPTIHLAPSTPTNLTLGSWSWTAGSDGTAGSGLSGKYRYNLNSGAWTETTASLLNDIALVEGNNILSVQEQDKAGLWSTSATSVVKVDTTGPVITVTSHTSPLALATTSLTLAGEVRDGLTSVASMSLSGQTAGSGTVTLSGVTWTTAGLTLKSGANTLVITATDLVGNSRKVNFTVNVNIPAAKVVITSPADNSTLTNRDTLRVFYTLDGVAQNQLFNLNEGINSLIVSSTANESGNIGRDTVSVRRDGTAPLAPTLTVDAALHKSTATWRWTSGGDNSGGAGMRTPPTFQYSTDGGTSWTPTSALFLTTTPAEGAYSLIVQEQDKAGNWSLSSASRTVTIDKTAPVVTITSPADGYITNRDTLTIRYSEKDGSSAAVDKSVKVSLSSDQSGNTVTVTSAADAAGNTSTASITVWRRSNVLFVRAGGAGNGDGSSWSHAFGSLQQALSEANSTSRKQIWMGSGTFLAPSKRGFQLSSGVSIYGGFGTTGLPNRISQRDSSLPYQTILSANNAEDTIIYASSPTWAENPVAGIILNTLRIKGPSVMGVYLQNAKDFLLANLDISETGSLPDFPSGAVVASGSGRFFNCNIHHNVGTSPIFTANAYAFDGATGMKVDDCTFSENTNHWSILYMDDGEMTFNGTRFLDVVTGEYQIMSNAPFASAIMTFNSCTMRGGRAAIGHEGTVNYDGSNTDL